jgi:hypothetical protein
MPPTDQPVPPTDQPVPPTDLPVPAPASGQSAQAITATGYMMKATLADGILTIEGKNAATRFTLDTEYEDRFKAVADNAAPDQGGLGDSRTRAALKEAMSQRSTPRIPVSAIERLEFKDANPVINGRIDIYVKGKRVQFHFRRKTRAECRALYEALEAARANQ